MVNSSTFSTMTVLFATLAASFAGPAIGAEQDMAVKNFQKADADADGILTFDEFTVLIDLNASDGIGRAGTIKRMGMQSMAFGRIDSNADGVISTDELSAMAAQAKQ